MRISRRELGLISRRMEEYGHEGGMSDVFSFHLSGTVTYGYTPKSTCTLLYNLAIIHS